MGKKQKGAYGSRSATRQTRVRATHTSYDSPGENGYSLQQEARNTERHRDFWNSDRKLRHMKINFVSGGSLKSENPFELLAKDLSAQKAQSNIDDVILSEKAMSHLSLRSKESNHSTSSETSELSHTTLEIGQKNPAHVSEFLLASQSVSATPGLLSQPKIQVSIQRSGSPTPSDSSEEIIVFKGRSKNQVIPISDNEAPKAFKVAKSHEIQLNQGIHAIQQDDTVKVNTTKDHVSSSHFSSISNAIKIGSLETESRENLSGKQTSESISESCSGSTDDAPRSKNDILSSFIRNKNGGKSTWEFGSTPWVHRSKPGIGWAVSDGPPFAEQDNLQLRKLLDSTDKNESIKDYIENIKHNEAHDSLRNIQEHKVSLPSNSSNITTGTLLLGEYQVLQGVDNNKEEHLDESDKLNFKSDSDSDSSMGERGVYAQNEMDVSDERLAQLLSIQQELGSNNDLLLDIESDNEDLSEMVEDSFSIDFSPVATNSTHTKERKNRDGKSMYPSASLMADVLEQDPYGGFDIMDFDRPSLRRKQKGGNTLPSFELSDVELEERIRATWEADRTKKRSRKREREELRKLGLLGKSEQKPDLSIKYQNGISLSEIREEMKIFLRSSHSSYKLPPMDKEDRAFVHNLALKLDLKSKSVGHGNNRAPTLIKTARTRSYNEDMFNRLDQSISRRFGIRTKGISKRTNVSYRDGDVVGATAPEIGLENKGRAMLEKMGWSSGTALGANNKGILEPISHIVKTTKAGLR